MSRIRNCLTIAAGAAAGLFLAALGSSATAGADTVPINPGLPGVFEQVVASSATLAPQLLQTTASALGGTAMTPAAPAQGPIATATLNVPQTPTATSPTGAATGLSGLSDTLGSVLPFPMPNFGGTAPVTAAPTSMVPGAFLPTAPMTTATPMEVMLIPGLP